MKRQSCSYSDLLHSADINDGKCLSKEYKDLNTLVEWRCNKGHRFSMAYVFVRQGAWCQQCTKQNTQKIKLEQLQAIAIERGGKCISKNYKDNKEKLYWQCIKGHKWQALAQQIKNGKTWCPECAGKKKHTIEEMQDLAKQKGGYCLSVEYKNNHSKLKWKCANGHSWFASAGKVVFGQWCPKCRYVNVALKLKLDITELQKLAISKGGTLLSTEYVNALTPVQWKCKEGHIWMAKYADVMHHSWCPVCAKKRYNKIKTD